MYAVNDGSILEVTIKGELDGQVFMTVLHYKLTGTLGVPDGDATINSLNTEINDLFDIVGAYAGCLSDDASIQQIVYQWIFPTRFHRVINVPVSVAGEVAQPALPPNVSAAITKRCDRAGRGFVGSVHMPAVPQTFVVDGLLTNAAKSTYQTLAAKLPIARVTASLLPVLLKRDVPADSPVITAAGVQSTSRVERRRTVGLGI